MNAVIILSSATLAAAALLCLWYLNNIYVDNVKTFLYKFNILMDQFILFIIPLLLSLFAFLLISGIRFFGPVTIASRYVDKDNVDFCFIVGLALFHLAKAIFSNLLYNRKRIRNLVSNAAEAFKFKDATKRQILHNLLSGLANELFSLKDAVSFAETFNSYGSKEANKSVVFLNLTISCIIYILICYFIFNSYHEATLWLIFLLGRFVWLDQIDRPQVCTLFAGLEAQTLKTTGIYIISVCVLFAFSMFCFNNGAMIASSLLLGTISGCVVSIAIIYILSKCKKHKTVPSTCSEPTESDDNQE